MQRIGGAGPNAGQASDTALFNHDHRSLGMASAWRIDLKWQERLKRTVEDAEVAPRAVVFDDGDHRLTHGNKHRVVGFNAVSEEARRRPRWLGEVHRCP